jgi:hypothetical protein
LTRVQDTIRGYESQVVDARADVSRVRGELDLERTNTARVEAEYEAELSRTRNFEQQLVAERATLESISVELQRMRGLYNDCQSRPVTCDRPYEVLTGN